MDLHQKVINFFKSISFERMAGTSGNEKAIQILKEKFSTIPNVKLTEQKFRFSDLYMSKILNLFHPLMGSFMIVNAILALSKYYFLTLILSIILLFLSSFNRQIIHFIHFKFLNFGRLQDTKNIIGIIEPTQKTTKNLVFVAHHDSISHKLSPLTESIGFFIAFIGSFIFSIHLIIYSILKITEISNPNPYSLFWGIFVGIFTFIEIFNKKNNNSKGVLDDASGVATLYQLALNLSKDPLENTKVILLASGAEEYGDYGAYNFVEKYKETYPPINTKFIILDSYGTKSGNIIVNSIGFPVKHFSIELESECKKLMQKNDVDLKFQYIPPLLMIATDHIPIQREGYEFIIFASRSSDKYHSNKDVWKNIDVNTYLSINWFIENLARNLDKI